MFADALITDLKFTMEHCTIEGQTAQRYREMMVEVSVAPTIIPAEEEDMKYVCKEGFAVEKYDDDGWPTDEYMNIEVGEVYEVNDDWHRVAGGYESIRLENKENGNWLELQQATIDQYFDPLTNTLTAEEDYPNMDEAMADFAQYCETFEPTYDPETGAM